MSVGLSPSYPQVMHIVIPILWITHISIHRVIPKMWITRVFLSTLQSPSVSHCRTFPERNVNGNVQERAALIHCRRSCGPPHEAVGRAAGELRTGVRRRGDVGGLASGRLGVHGCCRETDAIIGCYVFLSDCDIGGVMCGFGGL